MNADLLFDDYKVKLDYVRGQYDRLWQRFNFFLSVELALFGFLGYLTFDIKIPEATFLPSVVGIVVSLLWYVIGAEDRRLVEVYRDRADNAAARFGNDPGGLPGGLLLVVIWLLILIWWRPFVGTLVGVSKRSPLTLTASCG